VAKTRLEIDSADPSAWGGAALARASKLATSTRALYANSH